MLNCRALFYLPCILLALTGCSSSSEKAKSFEGLSPDVSALVGAICDRIDECDGAEPMFQSERGCVDRWRALLRCEAGLASAEVEHLDACVRGLASRACKAVLAEPFGIDVCLDAYASLQGELGYLAAGDACGDEGPRCRAGTSCHYADVDCGVCMADQEDGDACVNDCDGPHFCNDAGTCEPLRVEGESCATASQCHSRTCTSGKCSVLHLGDDCVGDAFYCGDYLRCVDGKCAALANVGEPCNPIEDDYPTCVYDAECVDGRCIAIGSCGEGAIGSPCLTAAQCAAGSSCSSLDAVCLKDAAQGEACSESGVQCAKDLYCRFPSDFEDGTCQVPEPGEVPMPVVCE